MPIFITEMKNWELLMQEYQHLKLYVVSRLESREPMNPMYLNNTTDILDGGWVAYLPASGCTYWSSLSVSNVLIC